ncbi:hypothetical protein CRUP_034055 [Coryphaenoides rupestris]|nr:hypothetical protein CRUP_034055 [Coryphaenoides rupestris]
MSVNGRVIPCTPLAVDFWQLRKCPGTRLFFLSHMHSDHTAGLTYCPSMLREPCLRNNIAIDVLYLDNTNCDPTRVLPSRQRATQKIKEIIRSHPNHEVVIGLYSLGKESLLIDLAVEFKSWVEVSTERMQTLRALELTDVFTTDLGVCRLRAVDQTEIRYANMQQWNRVAPTLAILPTSRHMLSFHPDVHVVPYSDHSSYRELEDFVSALQPSSLIPIVGSGLPGSLLALLSKRKCRNILVPESVLNYMLKPSSVQSTQQRHKFPLPRCTGPRPPPQGVVFESPLRSSAISSQVSRDSSTPNRWAPEEVDVEELEVDVEQVEEDVEQVEDDDRVVEVMCQRCVPVKYKKRMRDQCDLNIVNTLTDKMPMSESFTLSQFSQCNFAQMKIITNTIPSLRPIAVRRVSSVPGGVTVSSGDTTSVCSGPLTEEHKALQSTDRRLSCGEILQQLPFTQEEMRSGGVLDQSFIKRFRLIPLALNQDKQNSACSDYGLGAPRLPL